VAGFEVATSGRFWVAAGAIVQELMLQDRINVSNTCFIGDPDWVKKQYEELKEQMKSIRIGKSARQNKTLETGPPD
jgi:hypothetical protein